MFLTKSTVWMTWENDPTNTTYCISVDMLPIKGCEQSGPLEDLRQFEPPASAASKEQLIDVFKGRESYLQWKKHGTAALTTYSLQWIKVPECT
jgi:hypothetical protein